MTRWLLPTAALLLVAFAAHADTLTGHYVEARTTDVYTGPCFANADLNLTGKHAVVGWKIDKGSLDGVSLDGLGVAAVLAATDTLGLKQEGVTRVVLVVDQNASNEQRCVLVNFAREQLGGKKAVEVVGIEKAEVDLNVIECKGGGCAILKAGSAKVRTRCIDHKTDKACGNETNYFGPLVAGVKVSSAVALEHSYNGKGLNETWTDNDRRSAYVGSFSVTMSE